VALSRSVVSFVALVATAAPGRAFADQPQTDHGYAGFVAHVAGETTLLAPTSRPLLGYGGAFRIHGAPALALELGADHLTGTDVYGRQRRETPLTFAALVFPNPGHEVQGYFVGGIGYEWARVSGDDWRYVAGWLGGGVERFVSPEISLSIDARGFLRGRTDDATAFEDPHRPTMSWGGLLTIGVALYVFQK
jgi:hypothetical protein